MTKDEIFDKIDDVYSEHDGGTIYLSDERTERLKEIIQQAINFIPCCTELNHDFKIGDDVWITSKKLVTIADFCEDLERVQVEDGCNYYLVDKDELTKVV